MKKLTLLCCFFAGLATTGICQTNNLFKNDIPEKAKSLQRILALTNTQTAQLTGILTQSSQQIEKLAATDKGDINKLIAAIGPLRNTTFHKIMLLLTPQQAARFDKFIKRINSLGNGRWEDSFAFSKGL